MTKVANARAWVARKLKGLHPRSTPAVPPEREPPPSEAKVPTSPDSSEFPQAPPEAPPAEQREESLRTKALKFAGKSAAGRVIPGANAGMAALDMVGALKVLHDPEVSKNKKTYVIAKAGLGVAATVVAGAGIASVGLEVGEFLLSRGRSKPSEAPPVQTEPPKSAD
jgi:hypothetical protein